MRTLIRGEVNLDLTRSDRQPPVMISLVVKAGGALWSAFFLLGLTGDAWLSAVALVGYPAAWSVAWLISK